MRRAASSASGSAAGSRPLHVERLARVRERVQRRAAGHAPRHAERELDVVDDRLVVRAAASASHAPVRVADAVVPRPLRAGVRRRDGDERQPRLGGDALAPCRSSSRRRARARPPRRRRRSRVLSEARSSGRRLRAGASQRSVASRNARRPPSTSGSASSPRRTIKSSRSRARSRNACAARVSDRPGERARKMSRAGSSPSTRASASVPDASAASIAEREMNVTPYPASTAVRTDSCSPSSSRVSKSRVRTPALRSASSIASRTPAPSCMKIRLSPRRSSSEIVFPANR